MSDIPPVTPAAGTTNGGAAEATPAPNATANPPSISPEKFAALEKQVAFACKSIREFSEKFTQPTTPAEPPTLKEDLTKLREEIRAEKKQAEADRKEAGLRTAIASHGIDAVRAELLFDHINARHGGNVKVEGRTEIYEDPLTADKQPLKDFVGSLLSGPLGEMFKAAPAPGPDTRGLGTNRNANQARAKFSDLSTEEQQKLVKSGQAARYVAEDLGLK